MLKIDCYKVFSGPTTNIFTGLCGSINSKIIMYTVLNVGIHYVREYLFDFVVDLELEK